MVKKGMALKLNFSYTMNHANFSSEKDLTSKGINSAPYFSVKKWLVLQILIRVRKEKLVSQRKLSIFS
jgi:hypothetical protein